MGFLKKSNFRKLIGGDHFVGGSKLAENLHAGRGQHPPGFGGLGGPIMGFYGGFMRGSKFGIEKKSFRASPSQADDMVLKKSTGNPSHSINL